ncbi:hypothetical protein BGZ83_011850 [Gryganskiella cystojenkinii]|nr:hypothetical protein BGZ83_011850 [Gryganskiella cystojenkinii]
MGSIRLSLRRGDKKKQRPALSPSFFSSGSELTRETAEVLAGPVGEATGQAQSAADTLQQQQQLQQGTTESEQDDRDSTTRAAGQSIGREGFTVALSLFAKVKARVMHHALHPVSSKISQSSNSSGNSSGADSGTHEGGARPHGATKEEVEEEVEESPETGRGSRTTCAPGTGSGSNTVSHGLSPHGGVHPTISALLHMDNDTTDNQNRPTNNSNPVHDQISIHSDSTSCLDSMDGGAGQDPANDSESTVTDLDEAGTSLRHRKYVFEDEVDDHHHHPHEETAVIIVETNGSMTTTTASIPPPSGENSTVQEQDTSNTNTEEHTAVIADLPLILVDEADKQDPIKLFQSVLTRRHETEAQIEESLHDLRRLILAYGIPSEPADASGSPMTGPRCKPSIRAKCWKLLLEVHHVSAQEYISLVKQGKPEEYGKIRNDTFRTLATDKKFLDVVEEDSLIRVLCAFSWSTQATSSDESGVSFTYVQGMNVLAAPFLYAMSEMDAFYSYSNFIKNCCPLYVQPTLQGVHWGIKLLEECLAKIDPELYDYLRSKRLSAELYAFPSILTICACTPPLDQAMQLWDFLLSWGIHLNIICIIAQLHSIRDELMSHASPMKLLRIFPDLDADRIIGETIRMIRLLPDELYDLLVRHPYDPSVADQIG